MADPRATVLIVDDSQSALTALGDLFRAQGFAVETARDGQAGLKAATTLPVDLVILDLELPDVDGLEVLRSIRAAPLRRFLPVVMLSTAFDRQQRLTALKLGADDFLAKPWDDDELLARAQRCLSLRRRFDVVLDESAELIKLSVTDALTQLHNHRFFQERLREEFRRAQRYDDPLALLLIDLDNFKGLNERLGTQGGDQVLKQVAASLRSSVRLTDLLARFGGEEFVVMMPKTSIAGALTLAERIWRDLAALKLGPSGVVRLTASLGLSGYPHRSVVSADQLLRTAEDALYRAKREGRNKVSLYPGALAADSDSKR